MAGRSPVRLIAAVFIVLNIAVFAEAQFTGQIPSDSHNGAVTALVRDEAGSIISSGEDGFINLWDIQANMAVGRFQLSSYPIISMAVRPDRSHITIVESDGLGLYRISAWDYTLNKKIFTLRFKDPVSYITYSGSGNFLIAARSGKTGVVFVDPETGDLLQAPSALNGIVTFAATGKSERTMIAYSPSGTLSYWDLESGEQIQKLTVPQNLKSPVLFSSNRAFAGFDKDGLVVLDALSGRELSRNNTIKDGKLVCVSEESQDLICVQSQGGNSRYLHFRINNNGRFDTISQKTIPGNNLQIGCSIASGNQIVLGMADGIIRLYQQQNNSIMEMQTGHQTVINEIAASSRNLVLLNDSGGIGFVPLDFEAFSADTVISFEDAAGYDRLSADNSKETFVLWRSAGTRYAPIIRNSTGITGPVDGLSSRYPLRGCSVQNNLILFLDTAGNIHIYNIDTGKIQYRYNAPGALHASFINEKNIIIARSANAGSTPFLMVDTSTGETVPLAYPSTVGARVYLGKSGTIYAAVVDQNNSETKTTVISINTSAPADSRRLVEYQGEDTNFGIAECGGTLATTLGGDGATLFTQHNFRSFERSSGLPVKLLNTDRYFIALDRSGSILWHNASTGDIEAALHMYEGKWYLQKKNGDTLEGTVIIGHE